MSDDVMGDEVYQPARSGRRDHPGDLDLENALDGDLYDQVLDAGYSPPERPLGVDHHGTTAREQRERESLGRRLAEEVPEIAMPDGDGIGDVPGGEGEPIDEEVGEKRAGRIVATIDAMPPRRNDVFAFDVGIDGGAASAEEAAMHVVPDEPVVEGGDDLGV
ncbi:DUF5709 domain-containing protein [Streptomyces albireticuli]|uniref:DUF5709 domain-containing protein n=1 Tax=Streptomyces albireticuli TaxID=1940 RepID=A0A2A2D2F3_9ACTN|nr:DUF5709 domain-containing protein [Streptomyces albireticuli]MCD9195307.1 DUF5709 domain-containing protein [Streptomyces albireticuli]PAU45510.1 hypothetical protein CK936_28745 [Streptomyces albireticuli]